MARIFGDGGITDTNCTIDFETRSEDFKVSLHEEYPWFKAYFDKH